KADDVPRKIRRRARTWCRHPEMGVVFGRRVELAVRVALTFIGKEFVGHSLLDVVGLAGKDQERFILRLPSEPCDRSIVAVAIETPGHPHRGSRGGSFIHSAL